MQAPKRMKNSIIVRFLKDNGAALIALFILSMFFIMTTDTFLTQKNLLNVFRQVSMYAIVAVGMTYTLLVVGVDLSIGATVAATGCIAVIMLVNGTPLFLCMLTAIILGAMVGVCNGCLIAYLHFPPFIATLSMQSAVRGLAYVITGGLPTMTDNNVLYTIGNGYIGAIPVPIIIMLVVYIIFGVVLSKTRFGRNMYAVGGNSEAARFSGINNNKMIIAVYIISGALAGLVGIIMAGRLSSGQPIAADKMESDAIIASVLGGTSFSGGVGTIVGTLIGALIIGVLNNGLNLVGADFYWQYIAKAFVLILALFMDIMKKEQRFIFKEKKIS